jgi:hypothetical protein
MLWDRTAHYGWFAERYHWTPTQVDALPIWYVRRLPGYAAVNDEVAADKSKAATK